MPLSGSNVTFFALLRLGRPKVTFLRKSDFWIEKWILGGISSRFSFVFKAFGAICTVGDFRRRKSCFRGEIYKIHVKFHKIS